jgi:hypothetical protein
MKTRGFILTSIFTLLSLAISSAQNNLTISGKILARSGSSVENTAVIACLIVNDDCDEAGSQLVQAVGSGSSVVYQVPNLAAQDYLMLAWRDVNGSQEIDQGDELGVYQKSGKASKVRPPATGIDLRLALFNGDIASILEQADQSPATTQPASTQSTVSSIFNTSSSSELTLSGMVKPAKNSSLDKTVVLAGVWENGKYNQNKSKAVSLGSSGGFKLSGLEKIDYVLFAWRDLDNNGDISPSDEIAPFRVNGKFALATPPLANINLQFEKGDSSLDALIALTKPSANTTAPSAPNPSSSTTPNTTGSEALTAIDCGKKERFYGDYGCIIPAVDSYLGNTKCPINAKFPGVKQEKGFFTGYVYDSCNRPLANVEISAHQEYGRTNTTKTDSKGFYRVESQYIVGAFVYATIKAKSGGNEYSFTVYPEDRIYGNDGGIQNIHYDTRDSQLWFYPNFYGFDVPEKPLIEFILEPIKLLDGTTGKLQVFRYQDQGGAIKFTGVKYGQYNISAFLITPKGRIKTWLENKNGGKLEKITVTIIGTDVVQPSIYLSQTGNP